MLSKIEQKQQIWGGSNKLIDHWLGSRKSLLVLYCQLAGLPPYERRSETLPNQLQIKEFCNLLVDYVSEGHFEVFDKISQDCQANGHESKQLIQDLLPRISASTDAALDFNDKYTQLPEQDEGWMQFDTELSTLGQGLEERFEFEDQLLEDLFLHHNEEVTS